MYTDSVLLLYWEARRQVAVRVGNEKMPHLLADENFYQTMQFISLAATFYRFVPYSAVWGAPELLD